MNNGPKPDNLKGGNYLLGSFQQCAERLGIQNHEPFGQKASLTLEWFSNAIASVYPGFD